MTIGADNATRYPLAWPLGWARTPAPQRRRAAFAASHTITQEGASGLVTRRQTRALTVADALKRLSGELGRLGATRELLSTNVEVRLDGLPRSGQSEPRDPGAAVYFQLKGQPRCLACDRWDRVADNIAAIAQHIDALRRIDRYGVGTLEQAFAGYAALPPQASHDWRLVLGFAAGAAVTRAMVEEAFRERARTAHPDAGGSHDSMARLTEARSAAQRELNG
jgi:hypothetical protein